ncbi:hypothetical protein LK13_01475 [Paenibacillus polymyxa]|uniref:hypothetical protein n=1 Tax=Paenibacillus polymyxa TaxID=1406 RepID=UPI00042E765B|nr:hypothetical protein [Paenibacillus polymyxa]AHM66389.1 hypothetical protein PPSQR21_027470 [Paenibacillus polymyxa SQR-21]AIY07323.1 hypothetical protein LK13_01475 [Paenibacillus polymyxa]RGL36164.1 hypothetical protein DXC69_10745 [Paenibacillus polymyxa]
MSIRLEGNGLWDPLENTVDNVWSYKIEKILYMWLVKIASLNWIQVPTRMSKSNGFPNLLPKIERYSIN